MIYISGSTVNALNGITGLVDFSDTNASTVIRSAIGALKNGGLIVIRTGTYTIGTSITDSGADGIEIRGEGKSSTILKLAANVNAHLIHVSDVSNWVIRDLKLDGNRTNQSYADIACVRLQAVTNCKVLDCEVINGESHGIQTSGICDNIEVAGNRVDGNGSNGITIEGGVGLSNIVVANNVVSGSSDVGISCYANHCTIIGNVIHDIDKTNSYYGLNGNHGIACEGYPHNGQRAGDVTVTGNTVYNCPGNGITCTSGNNTLKLQNITITSNTIKTVGNGISVEKTLGATITGNQISTTSKAGIVTYPTAAQIVIADNQLDNIGTDARGHGISVVATATVVSSNRILTHSSSGINLQSSNNVLMGNYIENGFGAGDGIELQSNASGNLLLGNSIYRQAGNGVRLQQNNDNNIIIGNKCDTCSRYGISIITNTCANNVLIGNDFINNTSGALLDSGTGTQIGLNNGYVNENYGRTVVNGDGLTTAFTIPHGLPAAPTYYTAANAASNLPTIDYVVADKTSITVNYVSAPPLGIQNVVIVWKAQI